MKGRVFQTTISNCWQQDGTFVYTKKEATDACKPYWEPNCHCCIDKKIRHYPPIVCKELKGKCYYVGELEAKIKCGRGEYYLTFLCNKVSYKISINSFNKNDL